MAAFDCTYITATLCQLQLNKHRGLVGGIFRPDAPQNAFLSLEEDLDVSTVPRAGTMLEMVCWDPAADRKNVLSVCSLPVESNFQGPGSTSRGAWFMLDLIGRILEHGAIYLQGVTFDAHGSHSIIRRMLHGQTNGISMEDVATMPFWKELKFQPLPECCLPRLPIQLAIYRGRPIFGIPGICLLS